MKKIIISLIFGGFSFAIVTCINLSVNAQDLKQVEQNGKYGFVNNKGNFAIKPIFESVDEFNEGLAAVRQYGKWGFINKKGKFVVEPQYDRVGNFNNGLAYVVHSTEKQVESYVFQVTSHVGYINKRGKIVIPFYEGGPYFYNYSNGLIAKQYGDAIYCSYMDKNEKIVLDSDYFEKTGWKNTRDAVCRNFSEGLLPVYRYTDNTYKTRISAYMNKKGKIVHSKNFDVPEEVEPSCDFDSFSEGMASYRVNWKYGFINRKFEEVIPPIYDFAYDFKHGLAHVRKGNKEFYIDKKGNYVKDYK